MECGVLEWVTKGCPFPLPLNSRSIILEGNVIIRGWKFGGMWNESNDKPPLGGRIKMLECVNPIKWRNDKAAKCQIFLWYQGRKILNRAKQWTAMLAKRHDHRVSQCQILNITKSHQTVSWLRLTESGMFVFGFRITTDVDDYSHVCPSCSQQFNGEVAL